MANWCGSAGYIEDKEAFLYSLTYLTQHPIQQNWTKNAIYSGADRIDNFGVGDICVAEDCDINFKSYSNFGSRYDSSSMVDKSINTQEYLAGSHHFKVQNIEVFAVKLF